MLKVDKPQLYPMGAILLCVGNWIQIIPLLNLTNYDSIVAILLATVSIVAGSQLLREGLEIFTTETPNRIAQLSFGFARACAIVFLGLLLMPDIPRGPGLFLYAGINVTAIGSGQYIIVRNIASWKWVKHVDFLIPIIGIGLVVLGGCLSATARPQVSETVHVAALFLIGGMWMMAAVVPLISGHVTKGARQ